MKPSDRLHRIEGFVDLWVDACLRSDDGQLVFLSFYGRDSSVMQFISALELGSKEGGVRRFNLADAAGGRQLVEVGAIERLAKHSGRLPRQNIFGPLTQMWIYDRALQELDKANRIGWVVSHEGDSTDIDAKAWELVKTLSPVALQDHWRGLLMQWCHERKAVMPIGTGPYRRIGPVQAVRVSITDHFVRFVSQSVRERTLTL